MKRESERLDFEKEKLQTSFQDCLCIPANMERIAAIEGVKQMRGTSTCQVESAETTLVASAVPGPTSALILGR